MRWIHHSRIHGLYRIRTMDYIWFISPLTFCIFDGGINRSVRRIVTIQTAVLFFVRPWPPPLILFCLLLLADYSYIFLDFCIRQPNILRMQSEPSSLLALSCICCGIWFSWSQHPQNMEYLSLQLVSSAMDGQKVPFAARQDNCWAFLHARQIKLAFHLPWD